MDLTSEEKFRRWVIRPIEALRALPDGDGAFAALTIACGLYERFIDSSLDAAGIVANPGAFREAAAKDLGCERKAVDRFWDGYRLGLAHAYHPKKYTEKAGQGDSWGWEMAEAHGFEKYPVVVQTSARSFLVRIDRWKFVAHVLQRWQENPNLRDQLEEFAFGNVQPISPPTADSFSRSEYRTVSDSPVLPATGAPPRVS